MVEHLKCFNTQEEYEEYVNSGELLKPNVSYCRNEREVNYDENFFCKLTLSNGDIIDIDGKGKLTKEMVQPYTGNCVSVETGKLCSCIGSYTFWGFDIVSSITLGNGVKELENEAFYVHNDYFKTITTPKSIRRFGDQVFDGCIMENAVINGKAGTLGWATFRYCSRLKSVKICGGILSIGDCTFEGCFDLETVELEKGVEIIGFGSFANCTSLSSITLPSTITLIKDVGFCYCTNLTAITSLAMTAPTLETEVFIQINENGKLYIPSGASGYDAWLSKLPQGWSIETIQQ